jgi:hypothetical protein
MASPTPTHQCSEEKANLLSSRTWFFERAKFQSPNTRDVEHCIEVTAETLYEAIATALAALQQDNWVGEIGQGFTTVIVVVQQPPVSTKSK